MKPKMDTPEERSQRVQMLMDTMSDAYIPKLRKQQWEAAQDMVYLIEAFASLIGATMALTIPVDEPDTWLRMMNMVLDRVRGSSEAQLADVMPNPTTPWRKEEPQTA